MKRLVAPLLFLFLAAPLAHAAEGVQWAKTLADAKTQAKERGAMIFIGMAEDHEPANDQQKANWQDPSFVKVSRDFVCVYGNPEAEHGKTKVKVDGETVQRCREAPGIDCSDHQKCWSEVLEDYADLATDSSGYTKIPFQFVIDANGKVLQLIANGNPQSGFDPVDTGTLISNLKSLLAKHGKGLSAGQYQELKVKLAEAAKEREAKRYKKALKLYDEVIAANDKSALADQARDGKGLIIGQGRKQLNEALAAVEEDALAAIIALEKLKAEYSGTEIAKEAMAKISELKRRPDVKKKLSQMASRKAAQTLMDKATAALEKERYAEALKYFDQVVEKYPKLPQAKAAKAKAEELRADEAIMAKVREQEAERPCKGWLGLGRNFAKNGMFDKARAQFQKVIDKYPGTSFAKTAEEELKKLEGK
jgi:tetratricopeptide (TPR) repeat protein